MGAWSFADSALTFSEALPANSRPDETRYERFYLRTHPFCILSLAVADNAVAGQKSNCDGDQALVDGNAVGYCAERGDVDLADLLRPGWLLDGKHIDGGGLRVHDEQPLGLRVMRDDLRTAFVVDPAGVCAKKREADVKTLTRRALACLCSSTGSKTPWKDLRVRAKPLRNPVSLTNSTLNGLRNIRVVEFDPDTLKTKQYIYVMDNPIL